MADMIYNDAVLAKGAYSARWAALTKLDVDIATMRTWDRNLPRNKRIMVPVDVQAMVVSIDQAEPTVPIASADGIDPEPFADGSRRDPGVHLHWAMPDALLRGRHVDGATTITMPALPDRWVVVRTLLPAGGLTVHVKGWVVDATKGSVTPLDQYTGTTLDATDGATQYTTVDGATRGTLLWTATYEGAKNRFAFHDDLADLPKLAEIAPNGFHADRAVYTVAGWWNDESADVLAGCTNRSQLQDTLHSLGWHISPESPDADDQPDDPVLLAMQSRSGLEQPAQSTPVFEVNRYSAKETKYSDISPAVAVPVKDALATYLGIRPTHYHSVFHGSVLGVPIKGPTAADDRPDPGSMATAIGLHLDDVTAAMAAPGFGTDPASRQSAERLMDAFTSGMLARLTTPDGVRDLQEHEHESGFWAFQGAPLPNARDDRLRADDSLPLGPTRVGRKGRGALAPAGGPSAEPDAGAIETSVRWQQKYMKVHSRSSVAAAKPASPSQTAASVADPTASRTVPKPAPRMFRPGPPIVAVRGVKPNARHHGDGLFDPEGLRCRWPGECKPGIQGVLDPSTILPTLGSGAIPGEVLTVVQEAVVLDPYASQWLATVGAPQPEWPARIARVQAEHVRLFGDSMVYDGSGTTALLRTLSAGAPHAASTGGWGNVSVQQQYAGISMMQEVAKFSFIDGTTPSPVAITTWRQPWVPLFIEWEVQLAGDATLDGWHLDELDLAPALGATHDGSVSRTFAGRSTISTGIGRSLGDAITAWLQTEEGRDAATPSQSQLSDADEAALARLRDLIAPIDLVSSSLDGIREQLLGIEYVHGSIRRDPMSDGRKLPRASALPVPLFGGTIEITRLRAVDAFGRVLDIPLDGMRTTQPLEVPGHPAAIAVPPRVQHGARWLFRFVDPGAPLANDPAQAPEAYVDQMAGTDAVTPIAGFLLPDHMDESLECFDRFGNPIGELSHDAISDAVMWEPAPGRPVPPDAGPLTGVPGEFGAHAQHVALFATGLMKADIADRHSGEPSALSALSALLRSIDTTLWSIDTFQSIGSPTVAGLVGRPVAVVRATLCLDLPDDIDEVSITEAGGAPARTKAFDAARAQRYPVRIGDLGRSDDSVLGFFVDDDYTKFHIVDKVVAELAVASGRHVGYLGLLGDPHPLQPEQLAHGYLDPEDTLFLQPGQVMRLTILMLPAGKAHLTSGILPRKALALADDWVTPGLRKLVPSLRVGPVLVDPAEIRMPTIASLGEGQHFLRRTGPLTWKDDPIVAATSAAMLPRTPHEAQEGWIKVEPVNPNAQPASGGK